MPYGHSKPNSRLGEEMYAVDSRRTPQPAQQLYQVGANHPCAAGVGGSPHPLRSPAAIYSRWSSPPARRALTGPAAALRRRAAWILATSSVGEKGLTM